MRIVCPACEAQYDVPDSVAGSGRKVRCARCQTVWLAAEGAIMPAAEAAPVEAAFEAAPAAHPEQVAASMPAPATPAVQEPGLPAPDAAMAELPSALVADPLPGGRRGRPETAAQSDGGRGMRRLVPWIAAWVLSLALISASAWAGYHFRGEVMRVWPASERLYAVLGPAAEPAPELPTRTGDLHPGDEGRDRLR